MEKIVTCYDLQPHHLAQIQTAAPDWSVTAVSQAELPAAIMDATIVCGHIKTAIDWHEVIARRQLKWIQSSAAGLDHCLVPEVVNSEVIVSGSSGLFARQVAEQTLALLLGLVRSLRRFHDAQRARQYVRLPTDDLRDRRVAILGFGGNGQWLAHVLRPLVGPIVATDCFPESTAVPGVRVFGPESTREVVGNADIVIAILPLLPSTHHAIDAEVFQKMPAGAYFLNVGRGATVDEQALIAALQSGHLRGAGLDVAEIEPLPAASPLWDLEQVLITPHVGAQARSRFDDATKLFCDNIARYRQGRTLINWVDKKLGFPRPEHRFDVFQQ
jgi:D-3-phosphoglycerate dehydrogenase